MKSWLRVIILCSVCILAMLSFVACNTVNATNNDKPAFENTNDEANQTPEPPATETPHEHTFTDWYIIQEPTCTKEGTEQRACETCEEIEIRKIPATGKHNYVCKVETPATCTQTGTETYTCTMCNDTYQTTIPLTEHSCATEVIAPTCTADGYTRHYCTGCDYEYTTDVTTKLEHDFDENTHQCKNCPAVEMPITNLADSYWLTKKSYAIYFATFDKTTNTGTYSSFKVSNNEVINEAPKNHFHGTYTLSQLVNATTGKTEYTIKFTDDLIKNSSDFNFDYQFDLAFTVTETGYTLQGDCFGVNNNIWTFMGYGLL